MKKFFSLVLALVMALSLTTMAWGVDVANATAAQTALDAATGDLTLTLTGDVTSRLVVDWRATLDYDEATPDYTVGGNPYYLATRDMGDVTVVGDGDTKFAGFQFVSNLTHENHHVDPDSLFVIDTLTIQDVVFEAKPDLATGGIGAAAIDTLIFNGVTFEAGAYISNFSIENVVFVGCHFTGGANGIEVTGSGTSDINVTVEDCDFANVTRGILMSGGTYAGDISITDNEFAVTDRAIRITTLGAGASLAVQDNEVTALGSDNEAMKLDSIDSTATINNWNNTYPEGAKVLVGSAESAALADATSGGATSATLYVWDVAGAKWVVDFIATGADLNDLEVDDDYVLGDFYTVDGMYFVETTADKAVYKLVYGAKTVYLAQVDIADYTFVAKASPLTVVETADAECGDFHTATVGLKDVFYVSYNAKTGAPEGFYKADKTTDTYVLVNGKLVEVEVVTGSVEQLMHAFKGYDVVNYQYTTVKCSECGKVAKLYANAEAAGKKAQGPIEGGWITFADYMDFGANAPVVTDKVTSAETFDAGIAMYVGMSVMAAAGSAVVIGKKKD
ncbi:MAG: hypothetical protein IJE94_00880 [Oscillospiraceae bacterium]|nr:hypothetical protein [Oscillospiraceae bacterium]